MKSFTLHTEHLDIQPINLKDAAFVLKLVNTQGWLQFIGDKEIHTIEDANGYIQKILDTSGIYYWVVFLKDIETAIGMVTIIKRDYLDYSDLGFAFLPQYSGKNYAYEGTSAVLNALLNQTENLRLSAITTLDNTKSMNLLERLGFKYIKKLTHEGEILQLFEVGKERLIDLH